MTQYFFVTGTDTGVGKTTASVTLLHIFNKLQYRTIGIKPVASGCIFQEGKLYNEDALLLQAAASIPIPYELVNPFALEAPIAPHIAAQRQNVEITCTEVVACIQRLSVYQADVVLIEGVGGWSVPLNAHELMSDVVVALKLPVLLVVAIRLGCLNHALLSGQAIVKAGGELAGWVANQVDPRLEAFEENIHSLKTWITAPCLGVIPYIRTT